jgi:Fic family protein
MNNINKQVEEIIATYRACNFSEIAGYQKYKIYSIVTETTALEGSTLTAVDTQLLLDEGLTAKGKPLLHHLMVKDNYAAMQEVIRLAQLKTPITPEVLQTINGLNMKHTGEIVTSALGVVDGTKGEFRKVQAFSDALGFYLAPTKIAEAVSGLCESIQKRMSEALSPAEALTLSFEVQAELIMIHPWQDGNKRTSRLISNYIQQYFNLPLSKVNKEDSADYLQSLKIFKDTGDSKPFLSLMIERYVGRLQEEIKQREENLS